MMGCFFHFLFICLMQDRFMARVGLFRHLQGNDFDVAMQEVHDHVTASAGVVEGTVGHSEPKSNVGGRRPRTQNPGIPQHGVVPHRRGGKKPAKEQRLPSAADGDAAQERVPVAAPTVKVMRLKPDVPVNKQPFTDYVESLSILNDRLMDQANIGVKESFNAHIRGFHSSQWCFRSEWDQDIADTAFS
jgi:hypothetical protein